MIKVQQRSNFFHHFYGVYEKSFCSALFVGFPHSSECILNSLSMHFSVMWVREKIFSSS